MGFVVVPTSTGYPTGGFSNPTRVSFTCSDDGAGGQVVINGLGITSAQVAAAVDLKTMFTSAGLLFRSQGLLKAFRPVGSTLAAYQQLLELLEFDASPAGGTGLAGQLAFVPLYGISGGGATTPYLGIAGPAVAGIWRVELRLRHSIVG